MTIGVPLPDTRNPFAGKGLAVTIALLLGDRDGSSLAEFAQASGASSAFGPVELRHTRAQPTLSSLRAVAERLGARAGDDLLLGFGDDGSVSISMAAR